MKNITILIILVKLKIKNKGWYEMKITKLENKELTNKQCHAINFIKEKFVNKFDGIEIKKFELEFSEFSDQVYFRIWTGLKNDEGTMAEIYARDTRFFLIGKNGRIQSFNSKTCKWSNNINCRINYK